MRGLNTPWFPNQKMNEIAASSDGARIGTSARLRSSALNGMQLRVRAYANVKASGNVIAVTRAETQRLFQIEVSSAGVRMYVSKFARPTKSPARFSMLLARIVAMGATRKIASATPATRRSALPMRSVQCTRSLRARAVARVADASDASAIWLTAPRRREVVL